MVAPMSHMTDTQPFGDLGLPRVDACLSSVFSVHRKLEISDLLFLS